MKKVVHHIALTCILMSIGFTVSAQQIRYPVESTQPFNLNTINNRASVEEVFRSNQDFVKFNDNDVLMIKGNETHQLPENSQVVYSEESQGVDKNNHPEHEYVDLGLSVKWATCNVGAERPQDKGDLFAWGETEPKSEYTMSNYKFSINGSYDDFTKYNYKDRKNRLEPEDDAAHVNWGGNWRIPTTGEWKELMGKCTWSYVKMKDGTEGFRIRGNKRGYRDRSIFLPFTVYRDSTSVVEGESIGEGQYAGLYWTCFLVDDQLVLQLNGICDAWGMWLEPDVNFHASMVQRNLGRAIRPVCE